MTTDTNNHRKPFIKSILESAPRLIVTSFIIVILVGWILLMMPFSSRGESIKPVDALFTATSGVCVTGLTVIDPEKRLSFTGQLILLVCIQLGGLGIMTFSTFFLFIIRRSRLSFTGREALFQTLTPGGTLNIKNLLFAIFKLTFLIEAIGAALLYWRWRIPGETEATRRTLWDAIFHSVSAFCNAGFSTFSANLYHQREDAISVLIIAILIVLGGLGFVVMSELFTRGVGIFGGKSGHRISLQSRLVLLASAALIVTGAIFFLVFDAGYSLSGDSFPEKILHSVFQSVTARTAGFNTVDIGSASTLGLLLLIFLMFIGGSPGSAAGGVKTTTAAIVLATIISHIKNREDVDIFHRRIPSGTVSRAFIIVVISIAIIVMFFGMLALVDKPILKPQGGKDAAIPLLFETVSAFATVGLSTGITPNFNIPGKILIIVLMLIGRLGPLTIAIAFIEYHERATFRYAEEEVMVG